MTASGPAPAVRALNCPNCGGPIALRAAGYSVNLVCPTCGSTLDASDPDIALIERTNAAMRQPRIALGTRGTLDGVAWEAIGYLERSDGEDGWSEYLLFNPYRGYRWLIDAERRFWLGTVLDRAPVPYVSNDSSDGVTYEGKSYTPDDDPYPAVVTFVVGEFPWRVVVGERVMVRDYEQSYGTLSEEQNEAERSWTLTHRLDRGVAEAAFGIAPPAAAAGGPSPDGGLLKLLWKIALYALIALLVFAVIPFHRATVYATQDVSVGIDSTAQTIVMGPITVAGPREAVTVRAAADSLDNAWVDLDYSLVERTTQASFDASGTAEAYHGHDADGDWREGDPRPATRFAGVPRGVYDLRVELSAHSWSGGSSGASTGFAMPPIVVRITASRGASFPENFWLAAFLILLWPIIATWRRLRRGSKD